MGSRGVAREELKVGKGRVKNLPLLPRPSAPLPPCTSPN